MKIEIVEFYPFDKQKHNTFEGSLHIYICDLEMDIRGIHMYRDPKKKWHVIMPYRMGIDQETKKKCRFPIINFTSKRKNENIKKAVMQHGVKYIEDKLKNEQVPRANR